MEACAKVDEVLKSAVICKNLFLCNTQKTNFYLLMIREDKKFKTKEISKQINSARLSFAPPEYMDELLVEYSTYGWMQIYLFQSMNCICQTKRN
jgi:Ala-tRNA(Pro) deacylase